FRNGLIKAGPNFYFLAAQGAALWASDGTAAGTILLTQTDASHPIQNLSAVGNLLYFTGYDSTHGHELWVSDGTAVGTHLAIDINPGAADSAVTSATGYNGALY